MADDAERSESSDRNFTSEDVSKQLVQTERRLRQIVEHSTNMFYSHDRDGTLTYVSPQSKEFLGYAPGESVRPWTEYVTDHTVNQVGKEYTRRAIETGKRQPVYELQLETKDGRIIWVEVNETPVVEEGRTVEIVGSLTDITDRKYAELKSEQNRRLMESVAAQAWAAVWVRDDKGTHQFANHEFRLLFGIQKESIEGNSVHDLFDEATAQQFLKNDRKVLQQDRPVVFEEWVETTRGKRYYRTNTFPIRDIPGFGRMVGGVAIDITEQKDTEEFIKNSLREKETLLAEIHHRVKNNLAVVSSLMELQAMNSTSEELTSQLQKAKLRIRSMASIHEQIYRSENYSRIQFSDSLRTLVQNVVSILQVSTEIDLSFDLGDVELNISQGVPCSLLVNEVVSNIIKHSYKENETGKIDIKLRQENKLVVLEIYDDGAGLPADFEDIEIRSMGLKLIDLLTQQLKGEKTYQSSARGTVFRLQFPKKDIKEGFSQST